MIPGMNSRQAKQMMRKMGIQQQEIEAEEVIIRCEDKEIVISSPQVAKVNMMGQETYQIIGNAEERELEADINEEDINTVMEQAGVNREEAEKAIKENNNDLAAAIISLKQ